jgi:hypothetical protein
MDVQKIVWRDKGNSRCSASTASGGYVVVVAVAVAAGVRAVADLEPAPLSSPEAAARHARGSAGRKQKSGDD